MKVRIHEGFLATYITAMASQAHRFEDYHPEDRGRVYTACFFDPGVIVPRVSMLAAANDEEAIAAMRSSQIFKMRELWDRHRLVAVIPPNSN